MLNFKRWGKTMEVSVLCFILLLSACSTKAPLETPDTQANIISESMEMKVESEEVITTEDLMGFSLGYQNTYCESIQLVQGFINDMNSTEFDAYIESNGNDTPKMRAIGKRYQTLRESLNLIQGLENLSEAKLKEEFSESLRLLNQSTGYLSNWIDGNATLISFQKFKNEVTPELQSFYTAIEFVPGAYQKEFDLLLIQYPELENELTASLGDVEILCGAAMELMEPEKVKEIEGAFIRLIDDGSPEISREKDNAFRLYGETSSNCSMISVDAYDAYGNLYDSHQLSTYNYGDTSFRYGIREDFDNLKSGWNTYKFKASCDDGQVVEAAFGINFISAPQFTTTSWEEVNHKNPSDKSDYTNPTFENNFVPTYFPTVPTGPSARCNDGTYSSSSSRQGTCSSHRGVAKWL